jgi:hypothetical protein
VSDAVTSLSELDTLLAAAGKLPLCDGAAKLHALLARLTDAVQSGANVAPAARALASAATESLAEDPWVQFELAARAFLDHSVAPTPASPTAQLTRTVQP